MKRYIMAMAIPKKEARAKIESFGDMIQRHIIECVVYANDLHNASHWVNEISAWMNKISRIKCKSKLTEKDYLECLFSVYGDEVDDARWDLDAYHDSSLRKANYPDFDVTEDLAKKLFDTYQKFTSVTLPILVKGNPVSYEDWQIIIGEIFM